MDNYKIKVCRNRGVVKTRFVDGFGKNYIVSNLGQVFSIARSGNWKLKQLKPNVNHKGYSRVTLKNGNECKTLSLHRIVAQAFIENHLGKTQVNHINRIKSDNDVANLEWCTPKENIHHALKTGLTKVSSGEKKSQLTNEDVLQIVSRYHNGEMLREISKDYPVSEQTLSSIVNGKSWSSVTGIQHSYIGKGVKRCQMN